MALLVFVEGVGMDGDKKSLEFLPVSLQFQSEMVDCVAGQGTVRTFRIPSRER
jgi:hypothetical protein